MDIEHEATGRARVPGAEGRVGEVLAGKYRLDELLGAGAMGQVYRAVNVLVGRAVAIKTLRVEHASNPLFVERFMREARAANLVRHTNVVDVVDIDKDADGHPFIVQELLTGEDLAKLLARRGGKLPLEEVVDTICPVIEAVAEAHARGVVHRDIKPENVFLAKVGKEIVPKLLDFGISKMSAPDLRKTEIGVTMGTPAYMAPEQIQGARDADPRSDVWAIGVMLFELITGRLPFDENEAPALFVAIATKDAPTLLAIDPSVPPNMSQLVARCLRRLPHERYPSAAELARDLRLVMIGQELEPTGKRSMPPSMHVPDLEPPPRLPNAPIAATMRHDPRAEPELAIARVKDTKASERDLLVQAKKAKMARAAVAVAVAVEDASVAGDTAPSRTELPPERRAGAPDDPPPPPSLDAPRATAPSPAPARSAPPPAGRLAADAVLPGVMLPAGAAAVSPRRVPRKSDWGVPTPKHSGPDVKLVIGMAVVGVVLVGGVGALMQVAHRPEGWALVRFLVDGSPVVVSAVQVALALGAAAIGASYCRRSVRHWRGEVAGGPPSAILNAVVAAGAFFAAVELVSAAW